MTSRFIYFLGLIAISTILLTSVYLQVFQGVMPCPLCTLQRFTFALLGIFFIAGILFYRKRSGRILINSLLCLTSVLGIFLAGRQVWLQHYPPMGGDECGVSLQYMVQALPLSEVAQKIFQGSAECTAVGWKFLHLNMAEWALTWFIGFFFLSLFLFKRAK